MYPDTMNQFSPRQRETAVKAAFACTNEVFAGIEKVVELNVQTVKTSLSEQQALGDAALSAQSVSEVIDLQSQQFPAAVTKTFAYWRHVEDIAVQTRNELFSAMQEHFGSSLQTFAEISDVASSGFVGQERIARSSLLVMTEPAVAGADRVAIVDSSGKVLSSDDVRSDLH
ncbi:phasin family protein [Paraburkholderia sp. RP-4-7]|uniref:Phasin family protein n=1 Tax=Paraburkholderia polaris TaxID=2728848 RepID=A0A848IQ11_9BURK|nr:phasin family protein [Paraburkholderia polaris]NMM01894.1 phasin family protein [Paraburkholderia polaris]